MEDNELKVGDLVKTYRSGLYRITKTEKRWYNLNWGKAGNEPQFVTDENDPRADKTGAYAGKVWVHLIRAFDADYQPIKKSTVTMSTYLDAVSPAKKFCEEQLNMYMQLLTKVKEDENKRSS